MENEIAQSGTIKVTALGSNWSSFSPGSNMPTRDNDLLIDCNIQEIISHYVRVRPCQSVPVRVNCSMSASVIVLFLTVMNRITELIHCAYPSNPHRKCLPANALPEPDFKYRSNAMARESSAKQMTVTGFQGRYLAVWVTLPAL